MTDNRLYFENKNHQQQAENWLDENGFRYDLDGDDRLMVDDEGLEACYECGFDFEEI